MSSEKIKVFCINNDPDYEYEFSIRGYREDIYVLIETDYFKVNVYHPIRLMQSFETDIEHYGYYGIDPNVILDKEVTLDSIKKLIVYLFNRQYFEEIKPLSDSELENIRLIEI